MIRKLVIEGKIQEAMQQLDNLLDSLQTDRNTLSLLQARNSNMSNTKIQGIAEGSVLNVENNQIVVSFLSFFEELEKKVNQVLSLKYDVRDFDEQIKLKMMRRYNITGRLGSGSTAVIYHGVEISSGKQVAIRALKEINPPSNSLVRKAYGIKHRNIIEVITSFEEDIPLCLVLEYINGIPMDALLELGNFPLRDTLSICRQLCDALYYLHNIELPHRKLRPSKVLIDHELKPVISVFEIFKEKGFSSALEKMREDLMYISPEELRKPEKEIDFDKTDQFLLGLLMFEMLTGKALFQGSNLIEVQHSRERFFLKPLHRRQLFKALKIPAQLRQVLEKMLELEPENRFADLRAAERQLAKIEVKSDRATDLVYESYLRCCAKNQEFFAEFYKELFQRYPEKNYQAKFQNQEVGRHTKKKLQKVILQLIDSRSEGCRDSMSKIRDYPAHAGLAGEDYANFLLTLKETVKNNDFLWKRQPAIEQAWAEIIGQAQGHLK